MLLHMTSSFAALIISTATWGRHLTININMGRNRLLAQWTFIVVYGRGLEVSICRFFLLHLEVDCRYFSWYLSKTPFFGWNSCLLWDQLYWKSWLYVMQFFTVFHLLPPPPPDFARAVAARPISYAAVLRMKPDSSSVLNSRSRPRQHHSGGLGTPDWPAFSSHPLSALSLLGSQEDYRSEGKTNGAVKPTVCLLLSESKIEKFCFGFVKVHTEHETQTHK